MTITMDDINNVAVMLLIPQTLGLFVFYFQFLNRQFWGFSELIGQMKIFLIKKSFNAYKFIFISIDDQMYSFYQ